MGTERDPEFPDEPIDDEAPVSVPPQALDAEESVLGALMLSAAAIEAVAPILGDGSAFYRESHARIYRAALDLHARGEPVDAITLVDELERRDELREIPGGRIRITELAALVPATSNVAHYARIVRTKARDRSIIRELGPLVEAARNGSLDPDEAVEAVERAAGTLHGSAVTATTFGRLDLGAFLAKPPGEPDWDWRGWYARGDVVLLAGDPGVGKSMVSLAGEVLAARGGGDHLGEPVARRRVLYIDLESPDDVVYTRLHAFGLRGSLDGFEYVHRPAGFNLLDAGSLAQLRATIADTRAERVVIDSLRRAAPGLDENDSRQVSILFTALRAIAAELACTIVVIHHPRKPTGEAKVEAIYAARGSGDLIGSVDSYLFFRKLAGGLIRIEHGKARRGREHDHCCYRIVETDDGAPAIEHVETDEGPDDDELDAAVREHVYAHPGDSTKAIEEAVHGSRQAIRNALKRLSTPGDTPGDTSPIARGPGRHPRGNYWYPANHALFQSPGDTPAIAGDTPPEPSTDGHSPHSPAPFRGGETWGDTDEGLAEDLLERHADIAAGGTTT